MSKQIAISDDVYRRLKREQGDRSFSEVIEEKLDSCGTLQAVSGQKLFDTDTADRITDKMESLSHGTVERVADDAT